MRTSITSQFTEARIPWRVISESSTTIILYIPNPPQRIDRGISPDIENKHKIKIFVLMACYIVIIITEFTANFQNCGINSRIF